MHKMLRIVPFLLLLALLLSGCTLYSRLINAADKLPVQEYLNAVSAGDAQAFERYLHPSVQPSEEELPGKLKAAQDFFAGRTVTEVNCTSVSVTNNLSLAGKQKITQSDYILTMSDGSKLLLRVEYLSDSRGEGFTIIRADES